MTPDNTQPLDLEACPFCGRPGERHGSDSAGCSAKTLRECQMAVYTMPIERWNRRSRPEDQGDRIGDRKDLVMERDELRAECAVLEAKLRALESPLSKGRECWVLYGGQGRNIPYETREEHTAEMYTAPGYEWIRMVEAPSKGEGEPSAARPLREASPLEEPTDPDLRDFGWAPGNYCVSCRDCSLGDEWADKRAVRCRPCAVKRFKALKARSAPNPQGEGSTPQSPSRITQVTPETP